jgi:hypothetical protein
MPAHACHPIVGALKAQEKGGCIDPPGYQAGALDPPHATIHPADIQGSRWQHLPAGNLFGRYPFSLTSCVDAGDQRGGNSNRRLQSPASKVQFIERSRQAPGICRPAESLDHEATIAWLNGC